jgi:SAM-dependent methyltransferase
MVVGLEPVRERVWGMENDAPFDAIVSLNMVHIAPWEAALGLLAGAGRLLRPNGVLFFYGPFMRGGAHTAASNAAFDADLKRRDRRWGVRDVDDLVDQAAPHGLELREVVPMPAKNLSLVFVKASPAVPA